MSRQLRLVACISFVLTCVSWGSTPIRGATLPFDINLVATGAGLVGTNWVSLPTSTLIKTAEDLCDAIGPNATTVSQFFPDVNRRYTWTCGGGAGACVTTNPGGTIPEPGCSASDCFCIDDGEGYEVKVRADTALHIDGCESRVPIVLPAGSAGGAGRNWLASVPFDTPLVTWNDLALAVGLPSTGLTRGTVTGIDPATGVITVCSAGTPACTALSLVPGRAYVLRYLVDDPPPYTNPATNATPCLDYDMDLLTGRNWISLPTSTPIKTAEGLCAAIGPNATSVAQFFPNGNRRYTWTCAGGAGACLTTNPAGTIPEPGCSASACFCIDDGEGYEVFVSADTVFHVEGCESRVPIVLPAGTTLAGGRDYLASVPFQTGLVTWNDLALAAGLPSTGLPRGTVTGFDAATGFTVCQAGTPQCMALPLVQGRAYRLSYLSPTPPPYIYPTTHAAACFTCGNASIEAFEEQCDDGNAAGGDCCSSTCQLDAAGVVCTPDADGCTSDLCDGAGTCVHAGVDQSTCGDALICALTERCDPPYSQGICAFDEGCSTDCLVECVAVPHSGVVDPVDVTSVDLATGDISIAYTPACQALDHTIYWGDLTRPWDGTYTGQACNIGVSGAATFNPGGGSIFFFVVGNNGFVEGSYGLNSSGAEIPEAGDLGVCDYPQDLTDTCP